MMRNRANQGMRSQHAAKPTPDRNRRCGRAGNAGFTLVETVVAMLIAAILLGATYQVLVTTQRVSTVQTEQILANQTVRAAVDVLAQELRETSIAGGDLTLADADRVEFRALRTFGVACVVDEPSLRVANFGRRFSTQDRVFVFADGDRSTAVDDTWHPATVVDIPGLSEFCPGSPPKPAQRLALAGGIDGEWGGVRQGAPVRGFQVVAYHEGEVDGEPYLVRTAEGATVPLVGPLDPDGGLELEYLDADGNVLGTPATPGNVRRVRITVRAASGARMAPGADPVGGVLTTTVFVRN